MMLGRDCRSESEVREAVLAHLPPGRAWQTRTGGPHEGSVLFAYWSAAASALHGLYLRACALERELLCSTAIETRPEWLREFGLPDACGVEQNPCARGLPIIDDLCDLLVRMAEAAGFRVRCDRLARYCGERAGRARAGKARAGGTGRPPSTIVLRVDVSDQPRIRPALTGRYRAGRVRRCAFDVARLRCVVEPFIPAHADLVIVTFGD
ncbi:hypothetical protein ABE438_17355 [Bosea sp. TWI1241]|uniref:hypothetical protein n=1 Tax=Bosea sp. TWI1241 TaxID=3148904 RepID=UPI0032086A6E